MLYWRQFMLVMALVVTGSAANSQQLTAGQNGRAGLSGKGELLIPGVWVDPDGCEHWVMDDGWEGFMSPVILPNGRPLCGRDPNGPRTCGFIRDDLFFKTNSATLSPVARQVVATFFARRKDRNVFAIEGHTDSRASHAHNDALSMRRAQAVADIARAQGAQVRKIIAQGERQPRATNNTAAGRAANRRVEILCYE